MTAYPLFFFFCGTFFVLYFAVDLREVKEIRVGKNSKDFERWPDESKRMENMKCFVVFYGLEFRLKTLSIAGMICN